MDMDVPLVEDSSKRTRFLDSGSFGSVYQFFSVVMRYLQEDCNDAQKLGDLFPVKTVQEDESLFRSVSQNLPLVMTLIVGTSIILSLIVGTFNILSLISGSIMPLMAGSLVHLMAGLSMIHILLMVGLFTIKILLVLGALMILLLMAKFYNRSVSQNLLLVMTLVVGTSVILSLMVGTFKILSLIPGSIMPLMAGSLMQLMAGLSMIYTLLMVGLFTIKILLVLGSFMIFLLVAKFYNIEELIATTLSLVEATLLASLTCTGISPPGGFWEESTTHSYNSGRHRAAEDNSNQAPKNAPLQTSWHVASAVANHLTGNLSILTDYTSFPGGRAVNVPNQGRMKALGSGSVKTHNVVLQNVWYVPGLEMNLVSAGQLTKLGHKVCFGPYGCRSALY